MIKKNILVGLIILILTSGLFILTGCGNNENIDQSTTSNLSTKLDNDGTVNKLHFKYSSNANLKDSTNGKIIENENYKVIVSHQKEKTLEELEKSRSYTSINTDKTEWKKFSYKDEQVSSIVYMYERDNGTYVITFAQEAGSNINIDNEIEEFMNNIKFE